MMWPSTIMIDPDHVTINAAPVDATTTLTAETLLIQNEAKSHEPKKNTKANAQELSITLDTPIRRDRPHSFEKHHSRNFTYLDAGFVVKGIITYLFDVVTDILACIKYFASNDFWWAILTLVFILIGSVVVQVASFRWFMDDFTCKHSPKPVRRFCRKVFDWLVWIVVHVLQLGTINRYLRCLYFGWKSRKSRQSHKEYYIWKVYEQRDLTMLRLLEAFLEAGPQLVLQIYIMLQLYLMSQLPQFYLITALSAISSLISLAWSLEAYHKALRESLENKHDITYCGIGFRFVWRVSMIASRVTAMALFALHFKWLIFPVMMAHWALMTVWLIYQKTEFCGRKSEEKLLCCIIAVVHIFCFFNMKDGRSRLRVTLYYILTFFENVAMATLWYVFSGMYTGNRYWIFAFSVLFGGYFVGIGSMILYYLCLHPNQHREPISEDTLHQRRTEQRGTDQTDAPDWAGNDRQSRDKQCGNLFTPSGRRYLYWHDVADGNSQETQDFVKQYGESVNSNIESSV